MHEIRNKYANVDYDLPQQWQQECLMGYRSGSLAALAYESQRETRLEIIFEKKADQTNKDNTLHKRCVSRSLSILVVLVSYGNVMQYGRIVIDQIVSARGRRVRHLVELLKDI